MDSYEATRVVFSRIQSLDPENASKIMGYILIQDHGEKEMIRLAFGTETVLHSLILKAKTHLGLSPNTPSTPSTPSPFNPISRPNPLSLSSSSRITSNNGFDITNPSSPSSTCWFSDLRSPNNNPNTPSSTTPSLSYASIVNGTARNTSFSAGSGPLSAPVSFLYTNNGCGSINGNELIDDYQLQDHLSFLNDTKNEDLFDSQLEFASHTAYGEANLHRRSYSVPGICSLEDANSGLGWKPCLYFARGFCKNGSSCRFLHGDSCDGSSIVGSPAKLNEFEQCQELIRSKVAQQQKLAAASQFMASASFPYNKCMNLLLQQQNDTQRSAAAALMMGDELHKFGRCRPDRSDFSAMGLGGMVNPGSRQIYLTFPADSTFREEDVSNYFSIYGPVQDVRIPYQQKRMFGFVTFVYPETVKLILAKGNPHFVCDSRVLVKPYKEKAKVQDKKQQQQLERGEYSGCSSPSGLDSREPYDLNLGGRMFYNTQEMLRRKLEEQADLKQAIGLQERRLMNLQLLDFKNHHHHYRHGLSTSSPIPSPTLSHTPNNHVLILPPDAIDQEVPQGNGGSPTATISQNAVVDADQQVQQDMNAAFSNLNVNSNGKEKSSNTKECDLQESLEHILPDSLFASPTKSAGDHLSVFSTTLAEGDENNTSSTTTSSANNNPLLPPTSTLNMASLNSCFLPMPRFSSGHGTIGM